MVSPRDGGNMCMVHFLGILRHNEIKIIRLSCQNSKIFKQEFTQITTFLGHAVVDGARATHMQAQQIQLIESGYGLQTLLSK